MKRINTRQELVELAQELQVRIDWHEPDEQEVTAVVRGKIFDNAGFWPKDILGEDCPMEKHVVIKKGNKAIATVNLATLFAWACGLEE